MRWLPAQLESILAQTGVAVTVFASVDQSADDTEHWLQARAREDARIVVLPTGRFGGAAANFFRLIRDVELDAFDFVSFADQDDLWLPDKLKRAVGTLTRSGAAGYSANVIAFWEDGETRVIDKAQPQVALDFVFEAAGPGCTYVLTRTLGVALQQCVRNHAQDIDHVYLHDWFIYAFARAQGFAWVIDAEPCMHYRQHGTNQVGVNLGLRAIGRRARMTANGWAFAQAALIAHTVDAARLPHIAAWLASGRLGLLRLSLQAAQCRRRARDKVFFFVACWLYALNPFVSGHRSIG